MIAPFFTKALTLVGSLNSTLLYIALSCLLLSVIVNKYCYRSKSFLTVAAKLPGPRFSIPFIGNGLLFLEALMRGYFQTWLKFLSTYPHPLHFWLFKQLWIVLSEPKDLEAVFLSENAVDKEPIYSFFGKTSEGIFIAKGQDWRTLRSLLNPTFHTKLLVQFLEVMVAKSDVLIRVLEPEVGKTINIIDYTGRCMLDIICGTQMGVETDELETNSYDFLTSASKANELVMRRMFTPHLHPTVIFKMSSMYHTLQKLAKPMNNFAKMIISKRKLILNSNEKADDYHKKHKNEQIYLDGVLHCFAKADERSIVRKVTDILVAGSDTTAVTTAYALLLLGMYPDIQEKVYQEQCHIYQDSSKELTISTLSQMKYMEMVIKEVLRLYTAIGIVRNIKSPVILENGVELPAGCSVYLAIYSVHRNPKVWSHPHEFNPDHFLPESVAARPKYSYIPFSSGPRNCPGMTFGYLSMKIVLSKIVRHYKIHSNLKMAEFKHKLGLMLELENGYHITLSKR